MAEVTAALVKQLREKTSVGMMDCKTALVASDGDMEAAMLYLRKKGLSKEPNGLRSSNEGLIAAFIAPTNKSGTLVEVTCETDFVSRNNRFIEFARIAAHGRVHEDDAKILSSIRRASRVRRQSEIDTTVDGLLYSYIHTGGKIGVIVSIEGGDDTLARDIAMHIAACNPKYLNQLGVPAEVLEKEKAFLLEQPDLQSKSATVREKIMVGRLNKFYAKMCLLDQPFVKDASMSIQGLLTQHNAKLVEFTRLQVGEEI
jgi:elongation factor Ts